MKALPLIAIGAASLLGITACSSDKKLTSPIVPKTVSTDAAGSSTASAPEVSTPGVSVPDVSLPSSINIPTNIPGMNKECLAYVQAFASAFAGDKTSLSSLSTAFDKLSKAVPAELQADVKTLSDAFGKLATLYAKYNYDYAKIATDPEAQAIFSDQKFSDASDHVNNWLNTKCNLGS